MHIAHIFVYTRGLKNAYMHEIYTVKQRRHTEKTQLQRRAYAGAKKEGYSIIVNNIIVNSIII